MSKDEIGTKAVQDERIMSDGRPAFAWWNEIQMLRKEVSSKEHKEQVQYLKDWARLLNIVSFRQWQDIQGDIHIIVERRDLAAMRDESELASIARLA